MLRIVITERESVQRTADQMELVWTGPDTEGAHSRDTGVIVRELFAQAHKSVLVSGFAVFQGKHVFKTLADQMDSKPELSVRMFLNVAREHLDDTSNAELLRDSPRIFATITGPAAASHKFSTILGRWPLVEVRRRHSTPNASS